MAIVRNRELGPGRAMVKNPAANVGDARDAGSIPGSGRAPGEINGNQPQYSCLENFMDRGACWAIVHGVVKMSDTTEQLSPCARTTVYKIDNQQGPTV